MLLKYDLAMYTEAFEENGYDSLPLLLRVTHAQLDTLHAVVGMQKPEHRARLWQALIDGNAVASPAVQLLGHAHMTGT